MVSRTERNKKQTKDIEIEQRLNTIKKISKRVFIILLVLFIIFSIIYVSCRYIGNSGLVVREYSLEYENLPDSFYGLKIIQVSDIDFDNDIVTLDKVKKIVKKINSIEPDIIIFTGDLIYGEIDSDTLSEFEDIINTLEASIGKYAIFGEDDDISKIVIKNAGFTDISNSYDLIYNKSYDPILIVGIDSSNIDLESAFAYFEEEDCNNSIFTIAIMHEPDIIEDVLEYHSVDLAMAGHSLNGRIVIPGIGGIFTSNGAKTYIDSYYKIDNTDFYISGGIGGRSYPYRLFNHPSINLYRLK